MPNTGKKHSAGKPTGGIKGDIPRDDEGVLTPGMIKGAGGDMPQDVGNDSTRDDPSTKPHVETQMHREKNDTAP